MVLRTRLRRSGLALLLALAPLSAAAQVTPGSSGATTSTTVVESLSNSSTTTLTFSRDQTFVISGSNVDINGTLSVPGAILGGVTAVDVSPASAAFPSIGFFSSGNAARSSSSRQEITISASDAGAVQSVVLNPSLDASVRDPGRDFDLAVTQSTPGLTQVQRADTNTSTSQSTESLSVFTAPFVP